MSSMAAEGSLSLGQFVWMVQQELENTRRLTSENRLSMGVGTVELDVVLEAAPKSGESGWEVMVVGPAGEGSPPSTGGGTTGRARVTLQPRDTAGRI